MTEPKPYEPVALERMTTGIADLDGLIAGGIPRYSPVFIAGLPGTGKTILSQQIAFANARAGRTCLYLSSFAEPALKILRYLQSLSFFDLALFGKRVIYDDLGSTPLADGPDGLLRQLDELVRTHRPELLVIDSFKALHDRIPDQLAFRSFTYELAVRLAAWEVTTLLVGEYAEADLRAQPEFAIADGIVYLYGTEEAERQKRFLRVMKLRGTPFFAGEHFFVIGADGLRVYPRMNPGIVDTSYVLSGERAGSVIEGLNAMLGGGLFAASTCLISGASGTGKSLVALSFLVEGARRGEPGLLVSFEESSNQIRRNAAAFGWELEDLGARGMLDLFHVSPSELNIDQHAFDIKTRAEQLGARRIVIDSITAFETAVPSIAKYQSYLWALTDYCKRSGITVLLTTELADLPGPLQLSRRQVSFISDTIILLRYHETAGTLARSLAVLKMRGSDHDKMVHELRIEPPRLLLGATLATSPIPPIGTPSQAEGL